SAVTCKGRRASDPVHNPSRTSNTHRKRNAFLLHDTGETQISNADAGHSVSSDAAWFDITPVKWGHTQEMTYANVVGHARQDENRRAKQIGAAAKHGGQRYVGEADVDSAGEGRFFEQ